MTPQLLELDDLPPGVSVQELAGVLAADRRLVAITARIREIDREMGRCELQARALRDRRPPAGPSRRERRALARWTDKLETCRDRHRRLSGELDALKGGGGPLRDLVDAFRARLQNLAGEAAP